MIWTSSRFFTQEDLSRIKKKIPKKPNLTEIHDDDFI